MAPRITPTRIAKRASKEAELLVPDRVLRTVRRTTGTASARRQLEERRIAFAGEGAFALAIADKAEHLGAEVRDLADIDATDWAPHVAIILADTSVDDVDPVNGAYLATVRVALSVLPEMTRRHRGQLVIVSPCERPALPEPSAARAAIDAWGKCVRSELAHSGVAVTHVRVHDDADPDEAARRAIAAIIHRPRAAGRGTPRDS